MMQFRTKEEQVADFLREGIISGRFARGARLKQQEIATLLNTSITPVREALKLLEAEGYVAGDSYRGAVVAPFDIEASTETLNLRILLETQLVRGAVERATAADIAELKVMADEFARALEPRVATLQQELRENGYWTYHVLARMQENPARVEWPLTRDADYRTMKREDVEAVARRFLGGNRTYTFIARPK